MKPCIYGHPIARELEQWWHEHAARPDGGRVGILRGAGNAIVPQVAREFIEAYIEARGE